jgi:Zn-dependent protease with chaperone function
MRVTAVAILLSAVLLGGAAAAQPLPDVRVGFVNIEIAPDFSVRASVYMDEAPSSTDRLQEALGTAFGVPLEEIRFPTAEETGDETGTWTYVLGRADAALVRDAGMRRLEVDVAPIVAALREQGVGDVHVVLTHPELGVSRCTPAIPFAVDAGDTVGYTHIVRAGEPGPVLRLEFGLSRRDGLAATGLAAAVLLIPVLWALLQRRRSLARADRDPGAAFRFMRAMQLATLSVWVGWIALCLSAGPAHGSEQLAAATGFDLARLLGVTSGSLLESPAFFLGWLLVPPGVASMAIHAVSASVDRRLRGAEWRSRDVLGQAVLAQVAIFVPLGAILVGIVYLLAFDFRLAFMWIAVGLVCVLVFAPLLVKSLDMTPYEITAGELRDRIFSLASGAGVTVRSVFAIPSTRGRLANAFAVRGDKVMLSALLVERLTRRETDAVVMHELAHLELRHPTMIGLALFGAIMVPAVCAPIASLLLPLPFYVPWVAIFAVALGGYLWVRRRFEYDADARAVEVTRDPEALVAALAKVMRANMLPLAFGRVEELFLTHPSTMRRFEAIAARTGLPRERIAELVAAADAGGDSYPIPPSVASEAWVFSGKFRQSQKARIAWGLTANLVLTPVAVALAAESAAAPAWLAFALALVACAALHLVLCDVLPLAGYPALEARLAAKLERAGVRLDPAARVFVGIAPALEPRVYDGFFDWDLGFLVPGEDGLAYAGEHVSFTLRRDHVTEIRLVPGPPGWFRSQVVAVSWDDGAASGCLTMKPAGVGAVYRTAQAARRLGEALERWRRGSGGVEAPDFGPPSIGDVTSESPREIASLQNVYVSTVLAGFLSLGVGQLAGLSLWPSAVVAVAATVLLALLQFVPYRRARPTHESGRGVL